MNCDDCENRLLDLLYEELTPAEEAEVRAHARGCERCGAALARLSAGHRAAAHLPMLSPNPAVLGNILQAARAHAAGHGDDAPVRAAPREAETPWRRILEFVRDFATGPQAAMATVMLLVVAMGVWYLPERSPLPEAAGTTVMSPPMEGEAAPTLAVAPTAAPAAELAPSPEARRDRMESAARPAPEPSLALGQGESADALRAGRSDSSAYPRERAREAVARRSAASTGFGEPLAGLDDGYAEGSSGAPGGGAVGSARAVATAPTSPARSALPPAPAPAAPRAAVASADYEERAPADEAPAATRGAAEQAAGAVAVEEASIAESVHRLARSQRAAGQCASAVRHYESLLTRFPDYAGAPQAMVEAADCYERLGRVDAARRWLVRARSYAATRAVASRELDRLEAAEAERSSAQRTTEAAIDDAAQ